MSFANDMWNKWSTYGTQWLARRTVTHYFYVRTYDFIKVIEWSKVQRNINLIYFYSPVDTEVISKEFKVAKQAGQFGTNCMEVFSECPYGHGLLEKYSVLGLVTSTKFYDAFL